MIDQFSSDGQLPQPRARFKTLCFALAIIAIGPSTELYARQTLETDSLALVAIYNSTNGLDWFPESNWLDGPLDTWHGIFITRGRVDHVRLNNRNLSGSLPVEIGQMNELWLFEARGNDLSGSIPSEFGQIEKIGFIDLSENHLDGEIPKELFQLPNLLTLKLRQNSLSGSIPEFSGPAEDLRELDLSENQLSGSIPGSISILSGLQYLRLGSNGLSGSLPPELALMPVLRTIVADNNQLSGEIAPAVFQVPNLQQLTLNSNRLSGSIHNSVNQAKQLRVLDLTDNAELNGTLPPSMAELSLMTIFWYVGTNLCDSLDPGFQSWLLGIYDVRGADCVNTKVPETDSMVSTGLNPPYPNPSNGSSRLTYSLATVSEVSIDLWDLTGKRIAIIKDAVRRAGEHVVFIDTSSLPAGVYFARMSAGNFQEVRKLTVSH